ncbi:MAG: hypothetical protein IKZ64_01445 [Alphaproteobacteria bacterium]|nr:hypothetical protein [Alphaproteobacteria bacterium]
MFDKLKMKYAAKRLQQKRDFAAEKQYISTNATTLGKIILWPLRMVARAIRWVWDTICALCSWVWSILCEINLVGLINLALLVAIIVLCSMLILDILNCRSKSINKSGHAKEVPIEFTKTSSKSAKDIPLPMRRDAKTGNMPATVNTVDTTTTDDVALRPQNNNLYGDVIIESRGEAIAIQNGTHIHGSLYLQRMRKYVLPCNVVIDGNLFLRDLNLLQFCGEFTVRGNIYVSPTSSFGPIPYKARVGGQIIL